MNKQEIRILLEQAETDNLPLWGDEEKKEYYSEQLAQWYDEQGCRCYECENYREAEENFKRAIHIYWHSYNEDWEVSPSICNSYFRWAQCLHSEGKLKESRRIFLKALQASKFFQKLDDENLFWNLELDLYIEIGKIYVELGNKEMAYLYHEKAVDYLNRTQE